MNVYIWESLSRMSANYHPEGGVVVIADSLAQARKLAGERIETDAYLQEVEANDTTIHNTEPEVLKLSEEVKSPKVYRFPDAGCC